MICLIFYQARTWKSLKYKASPIPSRGLKVTLLLKFDHQRKWVTVITEEFVGNFYTFDFAGHLAEDDDDEGEIKIDFDTVYIIEEDSSESESENDVGNFKLDFDSIDKEMSIWCGYK